MCVALWYISTRGNCVCHHFESSSYILTSRKLTAMERTTLLLLPLLFLATSAGAADCDAGWHAYKDELCIKTFPTTFLNYDEAKAFCSGQGNEILKSSLVMVKEQEIQDLLVNITNDIYDNLWLGGRYDEDSPQFKWDDGTPLTYTNWHEGYPRDDADSNICIDMRPINAREASPQGKWTDVNCNRRNLVVCQQVLLWTLQDAIAEIIKLRKELESTQRDLGATQDELKTTQLTLATTEQNLRQELGTVNSKVVPVGSIYIEYYNQPRPASLWPTLQWQDVSGTYAGLFFRASGGGAAAWGTNQPECAPRITEMSTQNTYFSSCYPATLSIPASGWSAYGKGGEIFVGAGGSDVRCEGLRFNTAGCEVRPKNQAVRIWKRTA